MSCDFESPTEADQTSRWKLTLALTPLTVVALATSFARHLSFDEMYWLTIARRVFGAGDLPYFDLLDNKGPLLYVIFGTADLLPVPPRGSITILFAVTVIAIATGAQRLASASGQRGPWPIISANLVGFTAMALSVWAVTTEVIASAFIIWAFTATRSTVRLLLICAACLVDPRAVLLAPVVLAHGYHQGALRSRHVVFFTGLALTALATVLAVDELRFAFVEASLATRFQADRIDQLLVAGAACCPLIALGTVRIRRGWSPFAMAVAAVAIVIGVSSGLPFGHYWVYLTVAIPLLPIVEPRFSYATFSILGIASILAIVLATRDSLRYELTEADKAEAAAFAIADEIRPTDKVAFWASSPQLQYRVAGQALGFAPTSNYFAWHLSETRRASLLDRFTDDIATASLLVVERGLGAGNQDPIVAQAIERINNAAARAECVFDFGTHLAFRFDSC